MSTPSVSRLSVVASVVAFATVLVSAAWLSPAMAGPEPAPVPKRWQLDVEFGPLRTATISTPDHGARPYFYLTYKVVNNTGQDLLFAPAFELATDHGRVYRSGRDVPLAVTRQILDNLENSFLLDEVSITDTLLQGQENMKEGLVIWPAWDLKLEYATVYAAGFSGETATIEVPKAGSREKVKFVLRKTAELVHQAGGEVNAHSDDPLPRVRKRWIMR